jgi:mRNA interferase RelE/StbE
LPYTIEVTPAARRDLRALERRVLQRVDRKIRELADNPRPPGVEKLKGTDDLYRVRVGDYRILYQIEDVRLLVVLVRIRDRREAYR